MNFPDYYALLGVPRFYATQEEIRAAYLAQIKFFHPDANNVPPEIATEKTQELNRIYAILRDTQKKREYDERLASHLYGEKQQQKAPPKEETAADSQSQETEQAEPVEETPPRKKPKWIPLVIGIIMAAMQLMSIAGGAKCNTPPWQRYGYMAAGVFWYDLVVTLSYLAVGLIGLILIIIALPKNRTKKAKTEKTPRKIKWKGSWTAVAVLLVVFGILFFYEAPAQPAENNVTSAPTPTPTLSLSERTEEILQAERDKLPTPTSTLEYYRRKAEQERQAASAQDVTSSTTPPVSGKVLFDAGLECEAPLTIKTTTGKYYYVKLVDAYSEKTVLAFFVRGGIAADMYAPLGTYYLRYATGTKWYGTADLFGEDTVYYEADGVFAFTEDNGYINGWTIELYQQSDGNLDVDVINPSDF